MRNQEFVSIAKIEMLDFPLVTLGWSKKYHFLF